jgi:cytochrome c-type biogenesis protein CcmH/NrfG
VVPVLARDPESAEAHAAWARVACFRERDLERGEAAFRRSLELDPNRAESHEALASLLMVGGRLEEALRELERAISLDPLSGIALRQLGRVLYYLGDDEAALEALQSAELLSPGDGDITRLKFNALTRQGRLREADEVLLARAPRRQRPWLRGRYRVMRWYARRRMKRGRGFGGYEIWGSALLFAQVGEREGMYACMEAAAPRSLFYVAVDPVFDPYRGERRFQELLEREGYALP